MMSGESKTTAKAAQKGSVARENPQQGLGSHTSPTPAHQGSAILNIEVKANCVIDLSDDPRETRTIPMSENTLARVLLHAKPQPFPGTRAAAPSPAGWGLEFYGVDWREACQRRLKVLRTLSPNRARLRSVADRDLKKFARLILRPGSGRSIVSKMGTAGDDTSGSRCVFGLLPGPTMRGRRFS